MVGDTVPADTTGSCRSLLSPFAVNLQRTTERQILYWSLSSCTDLYYKLTRDNSYCFLIIICRLIGIMNFVQF